MAKHHASGRKEKKRLHRLAFYHQEAWLYTSCPIPGIMCCLLLLLVVHAAGFICC